LPLDRVRKNWSAVSLNLFLIAEVATLRDALVQIEANHHGIILTENAAGAVSGLATDGDIRRKLLDGASLDAPISSCANSNFVLADLSTPRVSRVAGRINMPRFLGASTSWNSGWTRTLFIR